MDNKSNLKTSASDGSTGNQPSLLLQIAGAFSGTNDTYEDSTVPTFSEDRHEPEVTFTSGALANESSVESLQTSNPFLYHTILSIFTPTGRMTTTARQLVSNALVQGAENGIDNVEVAVNLSRCITTEIDPVTFSARVYLGGQDENAEDNEEDEGTESYGSWMG